MTSLIEKVARAMWEDSQGDDWNVPDDGGRKLYLELARAAIAEVFAHLEEPSEAVIETGAGHEWSGGYDRQGSHASGSYQEYREGLQYAYGNIGSADIVALEVFLAMLAQAKAEELNE